METTGRLTPLLMIAKDGDYFKSLYIPKNNLVTQSGKSMLQTILVDMMEKNITFAMEILSAVETYNEGNIKPFQDILKLKGNNNEKS